MQNIFNLLREKLKEESVKTIPTCEKDGYSMTEEESMIFENDAIEIVNRVEEIHNLRICEWYPSDISNEWKPSCDSNSKYNVFGVAWFKYCPYCGRKIEIKESEKIKVTELDMIVTGMKEKPYYQIKYKETGKEDYNIGYGSYNINNVFNWKEECFEVVNEFGE